MSLEFLRTARLPRSVGRLVYILGYLLILCYVTTVFLRVPGINHYPKSRLGEMVYGTAYRPYVYRVLVPLTIRGLHALVPDTIESSLKTHLWANDHFRSTFSNFGWDESYYLEFMICLALAFLMYWGFAETMRVLFAEYYDAPLLFSRMVPIAALIGVPAFFKYTSYVYDPALILLFALALLFMQRRQLKRYLFIFILCCMNKETAILLPFLFALYFRSPVRLHARLYWGFLITQIIIFAAIKFSINRIYMQNPGDTVEDHLSYNMAWLQMGYDWFGSIRNGLWTPAFAPWVLLIVLVGAFWNDKPVLMRWALIMLVPLLALTFFLGALDEMRDYYEIYPALLILMLHTIATWMGVPLKPKPSIFA